MKLTVIDGGADPTERPPSDNGIRARLLAMVEECLKGDPQVAMLVWEAGRGGVTQLMTLVTPPSQAVIRGMVELMHEQIHSDELM